MVRYKFVASGNNSVVECDLAKVEVAGSNPVSRSIFLTQGPRPWAASFPLLKEKSSRMISNGRAVPMACLPLSEPPRSDR